MWFKKKKQNVPWISAVMVSAGKASRMEGIDKQQTLLMEVPVAVLSLQLFQECPMIAEIVLVCREEQMGEYYHLLQDYGLDKVSSVVKGGEHRQESVFCGIRACREEADYYAIHDGARPLTTPQEIGGCIEAALEYGAAVVGVPVKDTIKICTSDGLVESTPSRETLYAIQTPQIFASALYRQAMDLALDTGGIYTDDCQLIERAGHRVFVSPGSYQNIKITTPEDLVIAQAILEHREGWA